MIDLAGPSIDLADPSIDPAGPSIDLAGSSIDLAGPSIDLAHRDRTPRIGTATRRVHRSTRRIPFSTRPYDGETVQLGYAEYRDDRKKVLTLDAHELVCRFLLHVLPKGFMRVRHFGFLANRCRAQRLAQIRETLAAPPPPTPTKAEEDRRCPHCGKGHVRVIGQRPPRRVPVVRRRRGAPCRSIDPSGGGGAGT